MHDLFLKLFDCIFPPSKTLLRVRNLSPEIVRGKYCLSYIESTRTLSRYEDSDIKALIHEAKFHGNTHAFTLLNVLIKEYLSQTTTRYDCIIPIPLPRTRMCARGYNQVYEILRAGDLHVPIDTKLLRRVRHTRPQTELAKKERLSNLRDAFGVTEVGHIRGRHILLVDDVTTTGATLLEAKRALQVHKPASVTCLAIAH
jgi:ComF family protein